MGVGAGLRQDVVAGAHPVLAPQNGTQRLLAQGRRQFDALHRVDCDLVGGRAPTGAAFRRPDHVFGQRTGESLRVSPWHHLILAVPHPERPFRRTQKDRGHPEGGGERSERPIAADDKPGMNQRCRPFGQRRVIESNHGAALLGDLSLYGLPGTSDETMDAGEPDLGPDAPGDQRRWIVAALGQPEHGRRLGQPQHVGWAYAQRSGNEKHIRGTEAAARPRRFGTADGGIDPNIEPVEQGGVRRPGFDRHRATDARIAADDERTFRLGRRMDDRHRSVGQAPDQGGKDDVLANEVGERLAGKKGNDTATRLALADFGLGVGRENLEYLLGARLAVAGRAGHGSEP